MSIDLDRIEALAKLADDVVVAGYYDGEHLTPATVLALVAAARALPDDPWEFSNDGWDCWCYSCRAWLDHNLSDERPDHKPDCRWAIARAAMEGMR